MATRLAPTISPDTEFFWNGLRDHKLLIQRCNGCQTLRNPPQPMCPKCRSLDWEPIQSSGRGTVYSYVMPHQPQFPFFDYPYIVALIELDEGVRIVSNLTGIDPPGFRQLQCFTASSVNSTSISCTGMIPAAQIFFITSAMTNGRPACSSSKDNWAMR